MVLTQAGGYTLRIDPDEVDSRRFERLLEQGREANAAGRSREALDALEAGLALWRGVALADVAYEGFARTESSGWGAAPGRRRGANRRRARARPARHGDRRAGDADGRGIPLRERLRGQLMLALYRAGRQAEALRVYAGRGEGSSTSSGSSRGRRLRDLEQAILRQEPTLHLRPALSRRRTLAGALALGLAGAAAGAVVLATRGGTEARRAGRSRSRTSSRRRQRQGARQAPLRRTEFIRFWLRLAVEHLAGR